MIIKFLLLVFFLTITGYANNVSTKLFIVNKDFATVKQIVESELAQSNYRVKKDNDKILEIYFDSPELIYLKRNGYIRYKAIEYVSKKKKSKYNENIEYSNNGTLIYENSVKHYKNVKTFEGKHALLSLIKRKERKDFIDRLHNDGIKYPLRLKKIVEVSKLVNRYILTNFEGITFASININKLIASSFDVKTTLLTLEISIDKLKFAKLSDVNKLEINIFFDSLRTHLKKKNFIKYNNEYNIIYREVEKNVELFSLLHRYPYLLNLLYAISYMLFGLILIKILFYKRIN